MRPHNVAARRDGGFLLFTRREEAGRCWRGMMLERYFVKPQTIDRIRALWIGPQIEQYVAWLAGQGYGARCVWRRVPPAGRLRGVRPPEWRPVAGRPARPRRCLRGQA